MKTLFRIMAVVCGVAVLSCMLACGVQQRVREAADRQKRMNDLKQVGFALHNYHDANMTLPPDQATFLAWAQKSAPEVVPIVQSGQYTFEYSKLKLTDLTEGTSNVVLGYDNKPTSVGRLVLMADGGVSVMPEGEFQAKTKLSSKKKP